MFERSPAGRLVKISGTDGRTGAGYEQSPSSPTRNAIAKPVDLVDLVDLGVLRERTGRSYARVYEAAEVSRILRRR